MSNSNIDNISRKVVLFQSEILEKKKKISELLTEKTLLEREAGSLRENMVEVRQENADLQEIVYDLNKENNQLKSKLEQLTLVVNAALPVIDSVSGTLTDQENQKVTEPSVPDPLEQKRRETELEKQLFEFERNSTIPDYFHSEDDENNFDSEEQD